MDSMTPHPLQAFWNMAAAPIQIQALTLALELDLFEQLRQPDTAHAVADRLCLHPVNTAVWMDLLWSMGLLDRIRHQSHDSALVRYAAAPLAVRFFTPQSAGNCAQSWLYRARSLGGLATQLSTLVRKGEADSLPTEGAASLGNWAQAARVQIGQEQRVITAPAVLRCLDLLQDLPRQGRFLDLGGGPGHIALALARRLPLWHGVVCDLPDTVLVAEENIVAAGCADRLGVLAADLNAKGDIGHGYDLIWCSSVLHFMHEPQVALRRMVKALAPGGQLMVAHAEIRDDVASAARVMPFYTPLMLRGKTVGRQGDMPDYLAAAGCIDIQALGHVDFPMSPVWVYAGRRA